MTKLPVKIEREHVLIERMLGHQRVKHGNHSVYGDLRISHPENAVKLSDDEGDSGLLEGGTEGLVVGNLTPKLFQETKKSKQLLKL